MSNTKDRLYAGGSFGRIGATSHNHVMETEYGISLYASLGGYRFTPYGYQFTPAQNINGDYMDMTEDDVFLEWEIVATLTSVSYSVKDGVATIETEQEMVGYAKFDISGLPVGGLNLNDVEITQTGRYEFTYAADVEDTPRTACFDGIVTVASPANILPEGLSMDSNGLLSGTPTEGFDPWEHSLAPQYPGGVGDSMYSIAFRATNQRTSFVVTGWFPFGYRMAVHVVGSVHMPGNPGNPPWQDPVPPYDVPVDGISVQIVGGPPGSPTFSGAGGSLTKTEDGGYDIAVGGATGHSLTLMGSYSLIRDGAAAGSVTVS